MNNKKTKIKLTLQFNSLHNNIWYENCVFFVWISSRELSIRIEMSMHENSFDLDKYVSENGLDAFFTN